MKPGYQALVQVATACNQQATVATAEHPVLHQCMSSDQLLVVDDPLFLKTAPTDPINAATDEPVRAYENSRPACHACKDTEQYKPCWFWHDLMILGHNTIL
jgi:hypothetical protein